MGLACFNCSINQVTRLIDLLANSTGQLGDLGDSEKTANDIGDVDDVIGTENLIRIFTSLLSGLGSVGPIVHQFGPQWKMQKTYGSGLLEMIKLLNSKTGQIKDKRERKFADFGGEFGQMLKERRFVDFVGETGNDHGLLSDVLDFILSNESGLADQIKEAASHAKDHVGAVVAGDWLNVIWMLVPDTYHLVMSGESEKAPGDLSPEDAESAKTMCLVFLEIMLPQNFCQLMGQLLPHYGQTTSSSP